MQIIVPNSVDTYKSKIKQILTRRQLLLGIMLVSSVIFVGLGYFYSPATKLPDIFINFGTGLLLAFLAYWYFGPTFEQLADRTSYIERLHFDFDEYFLSLNKITKIHRPELMMSVWAPVITDLEYKDAFLKAITNNANLEMRILLVNPHCPAPIKDRQESLKKGKDTKDFDVFDLVTKSLLELYKHIDEHKLGGRIEVKVMDKLPPIALYTWGTKGSMAFFPDGKRSTEDKQLEFGMETKLAEHVTKLFYENWDSATSLTDYMNFKLNDTVSEDVIDFIIYEDLLYAKIEGLDIERKGYNVIINRVQKKYTFELLEKKSLSYTEITRRFNKKYCSHSADNFFKDNHRHPPIYILRELDQKEDN